MPYPNEHACRIREPGEFQEGSFRRIKEGRLSIIIGRLKGKKTTTTQAFRYPIKNWSASEARAHCKDNKGRFEAASKEIDMNVEPKEIEIQAEEKEIDKGQRGKAQITHIVPLGATAFSDIDEFVQAQEVQDRVSELTRQFRDLSWNILHSEDIEDKSSALITLVDELDDRLNESLKQSENDKSIFGTVKDMLLGKAVSKEIEDSPDVPKDHSRLFFWKEGDRYRFMTIYTNKYRDDDLPPEILSESSHEWFVKEVESGNIPYPKLMHWHLPGTKWGQSDWLHYDKDTGFMLASGYVDRGHEKEAEAIAAIEDDVKTSHGLMVLGRDKEDETIITKYISLEISDLPAEAAANKLTGFTILKEVDMSIPDEKKEYLLKVGLSEAKIAEIESDLDSKAKDAEEAGLEFKEAEVVTAEDIAEAEIVDTTEPEGETKAPTEEPQYATREEVAEAITEVVAPLKADIATIAEGVKVLAEEDEKKIAKAAEDTPVASIAAMVARNFRTVGSEEAKVDKRTKEAKDGPEETPFQKDLIGIPWLDDMLKE